MPSLLFSLAFHPQEDKNSFIAGELLQGTLSVQAFRSIRCQALTIDLGWRTSSRGKEDRSPPLSSQFLFQGDFFANETYSYPFQLQTPLDGPFSFKGKEITLQYYLQVEAQLPAAFNPTFEREIQILPHPCPSPPLLYRCGLKLLKTVSPQQHFSLGGWLFFKILFFWSGILFLGFSSQKKIETGLLLWSLGFFFLLIFFFRNLLAQIKIYPPLFEIQTNTFSPGQFIPFGLSLIARRRLQLKGIHVSLSCEEKSISVVRNNQITYRSTLFEVHQTYFPESLLLPEMEKKLLEKIKIPSEAPYVFSSPHHQLSYRLNLQIEIAYFPDYRLSKIIYVIPPGYHAL